MDATEHGCGIVHTTIVFYSAAILVSLSRLIPSAIVHRRERVEHTVTVTLWYTRDAIIIIIYR